MTSAYYAPPVSSSSTGKDYADLLPYIPLRSHLRDGTSIWLDFPHTSSDAATIRNLLNDRIKEGQSWPFEKPLSETKFRDYFFAHTAIVARTDGGDIIGAFYCKPNFPGRCSHYCNGGFITHPSWRRRGVGKFMAVMYLRIAKDLGFKAVLFDLVFSSNLPSISLWDKLGFKRLCKLKGVVRNLEHELEDAYQYYYDLDTLNDRHISDIILNGEVKKLGGDVVEKEEIEIEKKQREITVQIELKNVKGVEVEIEARKRKQVDIEVEIKAEKVKQVGNEVKKVRQIEIGVGQENTKRNGTNNREKEPNGAGQANELSSKIKYERHRQAEEEKKSWERKKTLFLVLVGISLFVAGRMTSSLSRSSSSSATASK